MIVYCHKPLRHCDILSSPLDMSLTQIDFGGDLISFEVE